MADKAAVELQNKLAAFIEARGGPSSTRDIVADFRTTHPREVEAAASTLYNLALTKLVDAVSRRRTSGNPTQGDLFGRLKYPNAIVVHVAQAGGMRPMRKPFLDVTLSEAMAYLEKAVPERKRRPDHAVQAIIARIRSFMTSDEMTVADGLAAAEASERKVSGIESASDN